jgi:hypothetical protein
MHPESNRTAGAYMTEALLTAIGLIVGVAATVVSLAHDEKASPTRRILLSLAIVGLCGGLITTYLQFRDQKDAAQRVSAADAARKQAETQLTDLQNKVGDLAHVETEVQSKTADMTALNKLGGDQYFVVIGTFKNDSPLDEKAFAEIERRLTLLYPLAESSGMRWKGPIVNNKYEMRFGHHLTPSAAEIFRNLASQGLANGNPIIRRE